MKIILKEGYEKENRTELFLGPFYDFCCQGLFLMFGNFHELGKLQHFQEHKKLFTHNMYNKLPLLSLDLLLIIVFTFEILEASF